MPAEALIRQLSHDDKVDLIHLVSHAEYLYRHLDWRASVDWLGSEPFVGLQQHHKLVSVLACPRDETNIRWIRLFAFLNWNSNELDSAWQSLFHQVQASVLKDEQATCAALGLSPWFTELLLSSGFTHRQDIIVLGWKGALPEDTPLPTEIRIRPMHPADIAEVATLDRASFDPLWHQTQVELEQAFNQAAYASVAVFGREIIGYQISTSTPYHAHLARLAVHPDMQRMSIGYAIVRELLEFFLERRITNITVNTQSDNYASQRLYEKLGFQQTGEAFPVYILPLS